jgi:rhamnose utilization protein RhaD (predicted bifunctional aldolase and dehydrogenase)
MDEKLNELINLSRELGKPEHKLAILGEGNTSADCGDGTIWVKASGSQLRSIEENGFSRVNVKLVLELMNSNIQDDSDVTDGLMNSLLDRKMNKPSVETFLHALCIFKGGSKWVGHTHPISVMSILCSKEGARPFRQHIYPDEIVGCGGVPLIIPYIDPGLALARGIRDELKAYMDKLGQAPRLILMENHGMVALGQTAKEVITISLTADKWAQTILGTFILGGPRFFSEQQARQVEFRPDEAYRRKKISM